MTKIDNSAWFFAHDDRDRLDSDRGDDTTRLAMKAAVELSLANILELARESDDTLLLYDVMNGLHSLKVYYDYNEQLIARLQGRGRWDDFRLRHRQLSGLALEFSHLSDRRPQASCNRFKAQQLNRVLRPLKDLMEEDMGVSLPLVSEEGEHSLSDVMVILRSYLDVSAAYVHRHYSGNTPKVPLLPPDWATQRVQDQILLFCMDEPRSMTELCDFLGYKQKKTVRKFLNPLLDAGLIARTIPQHPNSCNQQYITARLV